MTEEQEREFYELCQAYWHTPLHEQGMAAQNFGALCHFVRKVSIQVTQPRVPRSETTSGLSGQDADQPAQTSSKVTSGGKDGE